MTKGRQKAATRDTNGDKRDVGCRQQGDTADKRETKGRQQGHTPERKGD